MKKQSLHQVFNRCYSSKGEFLLSATQLLEQGILISKEERIHSSTLFYGLLIPIPSHEINIKDSLFDHNLWLTPTVSYNVGFYKGDEIEIGVIVGKKKHIIYMDLSSIDPYTRSKWFFEKELALIHSGNYDSISICLKKRSDLRNQSLDLSSYKKEDKGEEKYEAIIKRVEERLSKIPFSNYNNVDVIPGYSNLLELVQKHPGPVGDSIEKNLNLKELKDADELLFLERLAKENPSISWKSKLKVFLEEKERSKSTLLKIESWNNQFKNFKEDKPI